MKITKYIASFLYFTVLFCFIVSTAYFIISLSAKIFGDDGQYIYKFNTNSSVTIGDKNSEGSLVPVHLTLQIPDSINIKSDYFGTIAEDSYPPIHNIFLKENKKIQAINVYNVSNFTEDNHSFGTDENGNYKNRNTFQFIKYVNSGNNSQHLSIKTADSFTNIVLGLRNPIIFLFDILKMYVLALILKEVAKEIYFSKVLSKYISTLGYLLLSSQLIPIIYAFIDIRLFGSIIVQPQILESLKNGYFENIQIYFNPTIDINIYIVFLGAVLVLLTKLVERGRALEEENELTI